MKVDLPETTFRFARRSSFAPEVVLKEETAHSKIEFLQEKETGRILVKIIEK